MSKVDESGKKAVEVHVANAVMALEVNVTKYIAECSNDELDKLRERLADLCRTAQILR